MSTAAATAGAGARLTTVCPLAGGGGWRHVAQVWVAGEQLQRRTTTAAARLRLRPALPRQLGLMPLTNCTSISTFTLSCGCDITEETWRNEVQ